MLRSPLDRLVVVLTMCLALGVQCGLVWLAVRSLNVDLRTTTTAAAPSYQTAAGRRR